MGVPRVLLCLLLGAGFGCSSSGEEPAAHRAGAAHSATAAPMRGKPTAPIDVRISTQEVTSTDYRIALTGTPSTDVEYVLLELLLPDEATSRGPVRARFGKTRAGTSRTLTTTVRVRGAGVRVSASARVGVAHGFEPNRMADVILGTPPAARVPPSHTVILPTGERLHEVGP